jgi:hypothetical protein
VDHEPQQAVQLARVLAQVLQLAALHPRVHRVVQAVPIKKKGALLKISFFHLYKSVFVMWHTGMCRTIGYYRYPVARYQCFCEIFGKEPDFRIRLLRILPLN